MPSAVLRLAARAQVGAEGEVRRDAGERRLDLLEVAEHQVAEHRLAVAGLAAVAATRASVRAPRRLTSRIGSGTGSGFISSWLNSEKIAAFAPMPSASDTIATMVTNGV